MRLPVIAFALTSILLSAGAAAQDAPTIPSTPAVKITASQRAQIDSIVLAYAAEGRTLIARQDSVAKSALARIALRRKYRDAIRLVLTEDQRMAYDAWYEAAEAVHEARRPEHTAP